MNSYPASTSSTSNSKQSSSGFSYVPEAYSSTFPVFLFSLNLFFEASYYRSLSPASQVPVGA